MTITLWNPAWETGIKSIDDQHRQLLAQIESLLVAIHEDRPEATIPGILAFLSHYVDAHFSNEESRMQASGYPCLAEHRAVHDRMRSRVAEMLAGYREDPAAMTDDIVDFLTDWLIGHINDHDQRMARHLKQFSGREPRAEP